MLTSLCVEKRSYFHRHQLTTPARTTPVTMITSFTDKCQIDAGGWRAAAFLVLMCFIGIGSVLLTVRGYHDPD
jgi:hypothetical protein